MSVQRQLEQKPEPALVTLPAIRPVERATPLAPFVDPSALFDWVHPITGAEEKSPRSASRQFGAGRPGERPSECGSGHCGVDLDAPRGTPVVAVDAGVIAQIQRSDADRGGKYVRIRHDGEVVTSYMHLDDIPAYLNTGDTVDRGAWIGTLGGSGIRASKPHLHFSVEIDEGDQARYLDPAPSLDASHVIDVLEMTLSE
jgi:murein DD-endopeptidase MepM/ murein hydrolase activator NlpD